MHTPIWKFILFIVEPSILHGELFTSTTHLAQLLQSEIELNRQLAMFLKDEYNRLSQIEAYVCITCLPLGLRYNLF